MQVDLALGLQYQMVLRALVDTLAFASLLRFNL